jgi:hypothetical protein
LIFISWLRRYFFNVVTSSKKRSILLIPDNQVLIKRLLKIYFPSYNFNLPQIEVRRPEVVVGQLRTNLGPIQEWGLLVGRRFLQQGQVALL